MDLEIIEEILELSNAHLPEADRLREVRLTLEGEMREEDDHITQLNAHIALLEKRIYQLERQLTRIHELSQTDQWLLELPFSE